MGDQALGPLARLRVLEWSGQVASRFCGRLFAQGGADVVRRAGGEDTAIGYGGPAGRAYGAWLDAGKRRIADDAALAGEAPFDLIIAGQTRADLAQAEAFAAAAPGSPTLLRLSWFDPDGPHGDWIGTDEIILALNGLAWGFGAAEGPPMLAQGHGPQVIGGLVAANAALGALLRPRGARPARIAVNIFEANLCFVEPGAVAAHHDGAIGARLGPNRYSPVYPAASYRTADGWVGITCLTPAQWTSLCGLVGRPDAAHDPRFATSLGRIENADEIDAILAPAMLTRTTAQWVEAGDRARVPTAPMPTPRQLPETEHWTLRGAFAPVAGTAAVGPTLPWRMDFDGLVQPPPDAPPTQGPLTGLKVADFSMGWAGPLCARTLGDLGAEVVKVESGDHPDWWRGWDNSEEDRAAMEKKHNFLGVNRNKRGVSLDLTRPEGLERAKALVAASDIVVENYAAGVLAKLGLSQDVQRGLRPGVVSLTMPAFGAAGPWAGLRAYGSTVEQSSGLPFVNGDPAWPPCLQHVAFGDPIAGLFGAASILTALHGRAHLGGAVIDMAQVACLFQMGADAIVAAGVIGDPPRTGHARARLALCAVVPAGEEWLAVAADGPGLERLRAATGAGDAAALVAWTRGLSAQTAAETLQEHGVAAAPVQPAHGLTLDPRLDAADYWLELERDHIGRHLVPATPFRFDGVRPPVRRPAPTLGQHTAEVLAELA